jgi:hypothetical protein
MKSLGAVNTNVTSTISKFLFFLFSAYDFPSSKMKQQTPSGAHFRKMRETRTKATASSQVFMTDFLKGSNPSASSDIPENKQTESVVSENLNDESAVSQAQENESSLLQFDQSITSEEHDDLEQLNPDVEVLQFS